MKLGYRTLVVACLLSLATAAHTQNTAKKAPLPEDPTSDPIMMSAGFLDWHPDINYRIRGTEALREQKYEDAFKYFQRAAYFADKPSQAMLGELLWNGRGVAQDRPSAYVWMDLAAERGYSMFLAHREQFWQQMSQDEQARALEVGQDLYARYGDAAARPRIDTKLRRGRARVTGSRTGFVGNLTIEIPGPDGVSLTMDASKFYDERYWDPKQYQEWHDQVWTKPRVPRVNASDLQQVRNAGTPPPQSRVPWTEPEVDAPEPEVPEDSPGG